MFLYFQSVRLTRLTKQIHSVSRPDQHLTTDAVASSKHPPYPGICISQQIPYRFGGKDFILRF